MFSKRVSNPSAEFTTTSSTYFYSYDTLLEEKQNLEEALLEVKSEMQKNGKIAVSKEVSDIFQNNFQYFHNLLRGRRLFDTWVGRKLCFLCQ